MFNTKTQRHYLIIIGAVLAVTFLVMPGFYRISAQTATNTNTGTTDQGAIEELNAQIAAKKQKVDELQQQAAALQQSIDSAASKVSDIQSQISLIESQIAQTNFAIDAKQEEIGSLELEMSAIQQQIDKKDEDIGAKKAQLADAIKQLDANTRVSTLSLVLNNGSLAEFYSQSQAVASISANISSALDSVVALRSELQTKQNELTNTRDQYRQSQLQLQVQKQSIEDQRSVKDQLLSGAQQTKGQYEKMLNTAAQQEAQANSTIDVLEKQLQAKLYGNKNSVEVIFNSHGFIWPTSSHKVSSGGYFHDANYFKGRVHTGLDISTSMGSPVRATADGEVSAMSYVDHCTTVGNDTKCPLNFISIVHEKPYSSRYLHLSRILVSVGDIVKQGDVIGFSGGVPGTVGSGTEVIGGAVYGYGGAFSTGAHLHFEIRSGGLPDDPLKYLP